MKKFKLGQEVIVAGKYVKASVNWKMVNEVESAVIQHGITAVSSKYECKMFESPKRGIVVGIRSIGNARVHSPWLIGDGKTVCSTTTQKSGVYLVATNLRGLMYVPVEMIAEYPVEQDFSEEDFDDDFDLSELEDDDDDDFDDWDNVTIAL